MGGVLHVNDSEAGTSWDFYNSEPPRNPDQVTPNIQVNNDGTGFQMLPLNWEPWTQRDGNGWGFSIECQGIPNEPMPVPMVRTIAHIMYDANKLLQIPFVLTDDVNKPGFGVHYMGGAAWGGHPCPGPLRAAQRVTILNLAKVWNQPVPIVTTPEDKVHFVTDGHKNYAVMQDGTMFEVSPAVQAQIAQVYCVPNRVSGTTNVGTMRSVQAQIQAGRNNGLI
jgi:hypothetical protein